MTQMNSLLRNVPMLFAPLFFLCQCADKTPPEKPPEKSRSTVVGRVSSVSPDNNIVLIEKFMPGSLPDDLLYHSLGGEGRTASLRPTGERIRNFHAADLIKGNPAVGDAVYARDLKAPAPTSETLQNSKVGGVSTPDATKEDDKEKKVPAKETTSTEQT